ncbi:MULTISPECIES: DUF6302 family protein [unclassified Streptomyces]|uniref:DUF6302 family protein n=1 Tax=unclassified Streptomyces TaxID=2593676 RepID=UPI0035A88D8C
MQWSSHPDPCFVVEWGERRLKIEGDRTATTLGRSYCYSEADIAAFKGQCHKSPSSAVPEPCSPTAP